MLFRFCLFTMDIGWTVCHVVLLTLAVSCNGQRVSQAQTFFPNSAFSGLQQSAQFRRPSTKSVPLSFGTRSSPLPHTERQQVLFDFIGSEQPKSQNGQSLVRRPGPTIRAQSQFASQQPESLQFPADPVRTSPRQKFQRVQLPIVAQRARPQQFVQQNLRSSNLAQPQYIVQLGSRDFNPQQSDETFPNSSPVQSNIQDVQQNFPTLTSNFQPSQEQKVPQQPLVQQTEPQFFSRFQAPQPQTQQNFPSLTRSEQQSQIRQPIRQTIAFQASRKPQLSSSTLPPPPPLPQVEPTSTTPVPQEFFQSSQQFSSPQTVKRIKVSKFKPRLIKTQQQVRDDLQISQKSEELPQIVLTTERPKKIFKVIVPDSQVNEPQRNVFAPPKPVSQRILFNQRSQTIKKQQNFPVSNDNTERSEVQINNSVRQPNVRNKEQTTRVIESNPFEDDYFSTEVDDYDDEFNEQAKNAKYTFSSSVKDTIHDNTVTREETRDGQKVSGSYSYSDGFVKRTVHYEADENGYRIVKDESEPIGEGPVEDIEGRAEVTSNIGGNNLAYSITADDVPHLANIKNEP